VGIEFETVYYLEVPVNNLPVVGQEYSWQEVLSIADGMGLDDVVHILENYPPPIKPFVSDGCSGGCPEKWRGHNITPY